MKLVAHIASKQARTSVDVAHVHCANCSRYLRVLEEAEVEAEVVFLRLWVAAHRRDDDHRPLLTLKLLY